MSLKTGVFSDSGEVYHSEEHLGSTSIKAMRISPAHFYEAWKGPKIEKKSFDEGNLVHSVLLEQDLSGFVARPAGLDARTKEGKAQLEELKSSGKKVIDADVFDSLERRLESFCASGEAMRLYNDARIEESHYVQDHETGLYIKARPDICKPGILTDLKTTVSMGGFVRQFWNLGYNIQAGFYSLVLEQQTGIPVREFNVIVQEKSAPYGVQVFRLPRELLIQAKDDARALLNRASVFIRDNQFPSYDDVVIEITQPSWAITEDVFEGVG